MYFFACWSRSMRTPKWLGRSLTIQFNGIVVSPSRIILLSVTKTSVPTEHKISGTGSKNFVSGSLGVIVSGYYLHFHTFMDLWILAIGETASFIGFWFRAYTAFYRTLPQPCKVFTSSQHCNCLQKAIPLFYQGSYFKMVGNMIRLLNFMSMSPLLYFICCGMGSLIRSNAMWNAMMVAKVFCKSMDGSFGRNIVCRQIHIQSVCSSKHKILPFPKGKQSM